MNAGKNLSPLAIGILLSAILLWAGEPWEEKRFEQWTRKEVDQILRDSPWARPASLRGTNVQGGNLGVRWASSRTIQQALVRRGLLMGTMTGAAVDGVLSQPQADHVVLLYGRDLIAFEGFEPLNKESVREAAYLELSNTKEKIPASSIEFISNGTSLTAIAFRFPRHIANSRTIPEDEIGVKFYCQLESAYVSTQFDLRKMVRDGKPDL